MNCNNCGQETNVLHNENGRFVCLKCKSPEPKERINFDLKCVMCNFPVIEKPGDVFVFCRNCDISYFKNELADAMKSPFLAEQLRQKPF